MCRPVGWFAAATSFATAVRTSSPGVDSGAFDSWAESAVATAKTTIAPALRRPGPTRLCSAQRIYTVSVAIGPEGCSEGYLSCVGACLFLHYGCTSLAARSLSWV